MRQLKWLHDGKDPFIPEECVCKLESFSPSALQRQSNINKLPPEFFISIRKYVLVNVSTVINVCHLNYRLADVKKKN